MSAAPKTKASKLIEELNVLLHQGERDEFTLRRIKSEAEKLRSSDAFNAYILLGMLASLENNVDEMRMNHLAALKLQPNEPNANFNYSTSLNNLCFYSEAREFSVKAYLGGPGNLQILSSLIEICVRSGRIREARKWLERFQALSPKKVNENEGLILEANELLDDGCVSDDEVEEILELSASALRSNKVIPNRVGIETLSDEESYWLNYMFEVQRPPADIVELNFEAAERLANSEIPARATDAVIVTFTSAVG